MTKKTIKEIPSPKLTYLFETKPELHSIPTKKQIEKAIKVPKKINFSLKPVKVDKSYRGKIYYSISNEIQECIGNLRDLYSTRKREFDNFKDVTYKEFLIDGFSTFSQDIMIEGETDKSFNALLNAYAHELLTAQNVKSIKYDKFNRENTSHRMYSYFEGGSSHSFIVKKRKV